MNKIEETRLSNLTKKKSHAVKFTKSDATSFQRLTLKKKLEMAAAIMEKRTPPIKGARKTV